MQTATILIAEPRAIVRAGLEHLLGGVDWLEVVGVEADPEQALHQLAEMQPDLAVFDVGLPPARGLAAAGRAAAASPETRIVLLTCAGQVDPDEALATGAAAVVSQDEELEVIEQAFRAALRGRTWVSKGVAPARTNGDSSADTRAVAALSPRQREVLRLMAEGFTTREIAARLERSIKTIETHRAQLMRRLGTRSVAELVKTAIRAGLVPLDSVTHGETGR